LAKLVRKQKSVTPEAEPALEFVVDSLRIAELAAQRKAINLHAYNVHGLTVLADSLVLCSASSEPQMRAIFDSVKEGMKAIGVAPLHTEGTFNGGWLVMDYGHVIFHVFREEAREFYDLDGFWGDAPEIKLESE
jgi:ribosome-associated protein